MLLSYNSVTSESKVEQKVLTHAYKGEIIKNHNDSSSLFLVVKERILFSVLFLGFNYQSIISREYESPFFTSSHFTLRFKTISRSI